MPVEGIGASNSLTKIAAAQPKYQKQAAPAVSIANLGKRPTIDTQHNLLLEAHLLDFNGNIYDKDIKVSFIKKIRDEIKFASLPELKSQIVKDEQIAKEYFNDKKI